MVKYQTILKTIEYHLKCQTTGRNIPSIIRTKQQQFQNKYKDSPVEIREVYDKHGNLLVHTVGTETSCPREDNEIIENHIHEVHAIHTHPTDINGLPTCLSLSDCEGLFARESTPYQFSPGDTEYNFRSTTACSENGSSMKLIRGNTFPNGEYLAFDEEDAERIFQKLENTGLKYYDRYKFNYIQNIREELRDEPDNEVKRQLIMDNEFRARISRKTQKQIGSMQSFFEESGILKDLEKIDCKLEINEATNKGTFEWQERNDWEIERAVTT